MEKIDDIIKECKEKYKSPVKQIDYLRLVLESYETRKKELDIKTDMVSYAPGEMPGMVRMVPKGMDYYGEQSRVSSENDLKQAYDIICGLKEAIREYEGRLESGEKEEKLLKREPTKGIKATVQPSKIKPGTDTRIINQPKINWIGTREQLMYFCEEYSLPIDDKFIEKYFAIDNLSTEQIADAVKISWPNTDAELKMLIKQLPEFHLLNLDDHYSEWNIFIAIYFKKKDGKFFDSDKLRKVGKPGKKRYTKIKEVLERLNNMKPKYKNH